MAISPDQDWIDALIDEQARKNNMLEQGDIDELITDFQAIFGELIGFQSEVTAGTSFGAPHTWGDGSEWGFAQWGASIILKQRWHVGALAWGDGHLWGN